MSVVRRWDVLKKWLFTTNHKEVGVLYLVTSLYFFVFAGVLALLMRLQLAVPENTFLSAQSFNQAVTNHGLLMVFWFLSPLAFAFANYFVPIQIGAKDMAFPRLNALSYWLLLFGGLLVVLGFFFPGGAADFGWTMYAPLNTDEFSPQMGANFTLLGLVFLLASVTVGTVNFMVTITKLRAKGFKYSQLPMFVWGIFITVILMLVAFPSLIAAGVLLVSDRMLGLNVYSGTPVGAILWDHLFWFFGHPEVYIVLFPALGAVLDIISTFSGRPLFGKKAILASMIAAAILSMVVYAHHMFMTGVSLEYRALHSFTTESISVPFGIITLLAIFTMFKGRIRLTTPMLFALGSIAVFIIGGITGVFNSSMVLDTANRGGYWIVGHFHYVMVGAALFGLFGALYYWFPKMTGRMYSETLGKLHFIVSFIGFNILYFPMFFLIDMPRRVYTYPAWTGWGELNFIATMGAFIFGLSHLLLFANLFYSLKKGPLAPKNPWDAWTYEWLIDSPPKEFNFDGIPVVRNGTLQVLPVMMNGAGDHGHAHGDGHGHGDEHLSKWPLMISLSPFIALVGLGMYLVGATGGLALLVVGTVLFLASVVGWMREDYREKFQPLEAEEVKETWPFTGIHHVKLGMWFFLLGDIILFAGLIGAYLFIRFNTPNPPSGMLVHNPLLSVLLTTMMILTATAAMYGANMAKAGRVKAALAGTGLSTVFAVSFILLTLLDIVSVPQAGFSWSNALLASSLVAILVHLAHVIGGIATNLYFIVKLAGKGVKGHVAESLSSLGIYWAFLAVVSVLYYYVFFTL